MTIPRSHRSGFFYPVCETVVWLLAGRVKNLIEKKWPGLSDNDIVTGGLRQTKLLTINFLKTIIRVSKKI